jgi:hypothetical protein
MSELIFHQPTKPPPTCSACGQQVSQSDLHTLSHGVTSDCRPWPDRLTHFCCSRCGLTQTDTNPGWRESVRQIYAAYATYAAAGGAEQKVGIPAVSTLRSRSTVIADVLCTVASLPAVGQLLDIGCGRGAFLQAFSHVLAEWKLDGIEVDQRYLPFLSQLKGFRHLRTFLPHPAERRYDVISLIHVLEHLEQPVNYLRQLELHSSPGGILVVQVPDCTQNPFALTIVDHASHFTAATLEHVARAAGWVPVVPITNWIPKELTLVAKRAGRGPAATRPPCLSTTAEARHLAANLGWLQATQDAAEIIAQQSPAFGLFGTAVAATWLHHKLSHRVRCFVDEDSDRIGRQHLSTRILAPSEIPPGQDIFIGLAPTLAQLLAVRLKALRPDVNFHLGPSLLAP